MAKYEDYVKRQNESIEDEIDDAAQVTSAREQEDNVPERFKGKSREEIAAAWAEADRTLARQGNELGELRKTVTELAEKVKAPVVAAPAPTPVTMDELYDEPDAAMRRVVREESTARIDALERQVQEANTRAAIAVARSGFEQKHPTYKDTMADPEFIAWIQKSPTRVNLAVLADQGNYDVADELFSTYGEIKAAGKAAPTRTVRSEAAREVALERSGGNAPAPIEGFSRHELQEKRISAQRGNRQAAAWLAAHGEEIQLAYAEGRLTA